MRLESESSYREIEKKAPENPDVAIAFQREGCKSVVGDRDKWRVDIERVNRYESLLICTSEKIS